MTVDTQGYARDFSPRMKVERRRKRSEVVSEAMRYQLLYCKDLFALQVMCLSDQRGVLMTSTQTEEEESWGEVAEVLAAYAPLLYHTTDRAARNRILCSIRQFAPRVAGKRVSVRQFELFGEPFYLCALGEFGARRALGIQRAVTGLRRILSR